MSATVPPPSPAARLRATALQEDRPAFGGWLPAPSPALLEAYGQSALDYVGIDCQHGLLSDNEVARMLVSSAGGGTGRLVRVSANRQDLIGLVLDAGADGVIIPAVESAAEARRAVEGVRYPPRGARSYGPIAAHVSRDPEELAARALVLVMIETRAGLDAVEEIMAVDGVDGVYVGPADLGLSLGFGHQQFPAGVELHPALRRIVAAGNDAGRIVGIHAASEHFAPHYVELGFRLLTLGLPASFVGPGVDAVLRTAGAAPTPDSAAAAASPY